MPKPNDPPQDGAAPTSAEPTSAEPTTAETGSFVATGPININGVRAYNKRDHVTADAVKKNDLQDLVKPA